MYTGPNIITNGLQCYFDADNIKSYNPNQLIFLHKDFRL